MVSGSDVVFQTFFLMILGLRRYGELLKLHYKNEVILNIRTFLSQASTIKKHIEKPSENGSKIYENSSKMEPRTHPKCSCEAKRAVEERKSD